MKPATIAHWVRAGHLHPIHRGVYALGHSNITQEGRWMAATLALTGSFLSYGAAGQLSGIVSRRERLALHVSVPSRSGANPEGIVVHRPRHLPPEDTTRRYAIPTTTATRALWDLSSLLSPQQTRRTFEQAEKLHVLNRSRLALLAERSPSRKGSAQIRQLLSERPLPLDQTRSWLEDLLLRICRDHSLPLPLTNVPVLDYTVDFLWPEARFVVEVDGSDHLSSRQRDKDNARDIALARAGYLVRRYSYRGMQDRQSVAEEVLAILGERMA